MFEIRIGANLLRDECLEMLQVRPGAKKGKVVGEGRYISEHGDAAVHRPSPITLHGACCENHCHKCRHL